MSRRPANPAADRAAQNAQTIKSLLKLEGNKSCADCKRNKHPRWASWNLGIFICIRCSGIHRGMGTHISRVKSVDLDAWTDEQLQSVLKWGNSRANKYWEAKLAPGHVPSEAKIENFIRTKYESKRWVMDGPMPDPSTLDAEGDDDIPLNLVKEKHSIERSASQKATGSTLQPSGPSAVHRAPPSQQADLFGDVTAPSRRPNTTSPPISSPASKADIAPPKQTKPADSLLGLDFFAAEAPAPNRPSSAAAVSGVAAQSRPDLKQSILSLYATAPRAQPQQHTSQASFGGMQSPAIAQQPKPAAAGLNDAFSGLTFGGPSSAVQSYSSKPSAFAGLGNVASHRSTPSQSTSPASNINSGGFFDAKPISKAPHPMPVQHSKGLSSSSMFGVFDTPAGGASMSNRQQASSSGVGDLFDFTSPAAMQSPPEQKVISPTQNTSVFNLSAPQPPPTQAKIQPPVAPMSGWNNTDAWGSNDAWSNASTAPPLFSPPVTNQAPLTQSSSNAFGWSSAGSLANQSIVPGGGGGFSSTASGPPKVSADEDFGGWSSAAPVTPGAAGPSTSKPSKGFAASEDLFSNVWE